jgi:flagellin-specific chaperone FliS
LGAIYEWALKQILEARINRDSAKVQEVVDVFIPLYEGWSELASDVNHLKSKPLQDMQYSSYLAGDEQLG